MEGVDVCRKRSFFSLKKVNSPRRGQEPHFLVTCRSLEMRITGLIGMLAGSFSRHHLVFLIPP